MRAIDADALISEIKKETEKAIEQDDRVGSFWLGYIAGLVIKQPTIQPEVLACGNGELVATPEPQEGEWEQVSAQRYFMSASYFYRCSACGVNNVRNTNFCPNCGARMKGERQK